MPANNPPKVKHSKPRPLWAKILIALAIVVFIAATPVAIAEGMYQMKVSALKNEVGQVSGLAMKISGGVEKFFYTKDLHVWGVCIDDGPCPAVTKAWYALVAKGGGASLLSDIFRSLNSNGYQTSGNNDREGYAGKPTSKIELSVGVSPIGNNDQVPYPASSDKEWVLMTVTAYEPSR